MTREERLYAMRGTELIAEAEKLGVKVAHKGNSLKESKEKAIQKILAAEVVQTEEPEVEPAETVQEPENVSRETFEEPIVETATTTEKKKRNTWEDSAAKNIFAMLDSIELPEIVVSKTRDGYTYKKQNKKIFECWKCRENIRVCVNPLYTDNLGEADSVRKDGWKNYIRNDNDIMETINTIMKVC